MHSKPLRPLPLQRSVDRKTLSVVMCNYNYGQYIKQAIEAIISQSRTPDEFIILDDGSTDNSVEIIESHADRIPYLRFLRQPTNRGVFHSINTVLEAATGDYVYGGASDDYILPSFFEKAMELVEQHPGIGVVFGGFQAVNSAGSLLNTYTIPKWTQPVYLPPERYLREFIDEELPSASFSISSILHRKASREAGGYRRELSSWCDTFVIRVAAMKYGAGYLPHVCAATRLRANSFSGIARSRPRRILEIISNAVALMRSPEYRELFPEPSVLHWEQRYRAQVFHDTLNSLLILANDPSTSPLFQRLASIAAVYELRQSPAWLDLFLPSEISQGLQNCRTAALKEATSARHADYSNLVSGWRDALGSSGWIDRLIWLFSHVCVKSAFLLAKPFIRKAHENVRPSQAALQKMEQQIQLLLSA